MEQAAGYKSKSIEDVIGDLEDRRFWQLANEVAREGTHKDAANILRKLCVEVVQIHQAEQAARVKALEEAAQYHEDIVVIWENTKPPHRLRADNHKIFARDIRALKET